MPGVYLDPLTYPDDWNTVVLAGTLRTPGKCKVGKWERKVEYDHKKGKGTKGAAQTLKSLPPAEGEVEFWAWKPEHFAAWTDILALLKFDPSKGGSANSNSTAATASNAITSTPQGPSGLATSSGSGTVPTGQVNAAPSIPGNTSSGLSTFTGNTPNTSATANQQPALSSAYAIDIFHPAIADLDVAYVLPPEELGSWEEDGEASGMYKRTIKFVEFTGTPPNTSIAATPTGAAASNTATPPGASQAAGAQEGSAASAAAESAASAAKDAQGAWGAP